MGEGRTTQVRAEARRGSFDRFAERCAEYVSKAPFFVLCVALVVVWAPSYFVVGNFDTYQLLINTPTTIITFLLVALLQNTQRRGEQAIHKKLDALADGMADLMRNFADEENDLQRDRRPQGSGRARRRGVGIPGKRPGRREAISCRPSIERKYRGR